MPKYHVTARSTEVIEFDVEVDNLTQALAEIKAKCPEGYQVQSYLTAR